MNIFYLNLPTCFPAQTLNAMNTTNVRSRFARVLQRNPHCESATDQYFVDNQSCLEVVNCPFSHRRYERDSATLETSVLKEVFVLLVDCVGVLFLRPLDII